MPEAAIDTSSRTAAAADAPLATVARMNYARAANAALARALGSMPETILYGEDIAKPGGVFGVTRNLHAQFGERVFDTPISETAMLGAAVGAAMTGLRPIVEIMFVDFTLVAMDQIVNQAANVRYVSAGAMQAPLTIRTQQGALPGSCAQHAQNLEALFAHIPGLVVGLPATPQDAYAMLLAAIASNDPTIVIEHRGLYFGEEQDVDTAAPIEPARGAKVVREGRDLTLLSWSAMLHSTVGAADALAADGISAEVIDARWLNPFDWDTLLASVRKTRRLLVAHEANVTGGFGAEVAAHVNEHLFHELAAPVARIGVPDMRMPAAGHLQRVLLPDAAHIAERARTLIGTDHRRRA